MESPEDPFRFIEDLDFENEEEPEEEPEEDEQVRISFGMVITPLVPEMDGQFCD